MSLLEYETPLRDLLQPGELLLWSGRPQPGIRFRPSDVPLTLFGLVYLIVGLAGECVAIAICWVEYRRGNDAALFLPLVGLPFAVMGAYFAVGRHYVATRRRAKTHYGITDRRLLVLESSAFGERTTRSISLAELTNVQLIESSDGSGTLVDGRVGAFARISDGFPRWPNVARVRPLMMEYIDRPREVLATLEAARRAYMDRYFAKVAFM